MKDNDNLLILVGFIVIFVVSFFIFLAMERTFFEMNKMQEAIIQQCTQKESR